MSRNVLFVKDFSLKLSFCKNQAQALSMSFNPSRSCVLIMQRIFSKDLANSEHRNWLNQFVIKINAHLTLNNYVHAIGLFTFPHDYFVSFKLYTANLFTKHRNRGIIIFLEEFNILANIHRHKEKIFFSSFYWKFFCSLNHVIWLASLNFKKVVNFFFF